MGDIINLLTAQNGFCKAVGYIDYNRQGGDC